MTHHLALATALLTYALLIIGGTVNPTGSSLACPDWPLCHGEVLPEMTGGVFFEHSHRLVATLLGIATLALTALLWLRRREDPRLARLGLLAAIAVVLQGVLGGVTVLYELPLAVSLGHLLLSMLFFLLILAIAYRSWQGPAIRGSRPRRVHWATIAATATVLIQVFLGGLVRHLHAGRGCGLDPVLCAGHLWPNWIQGQVHMLHRFFGIFTFFALIVASVVVIRAVDRKQKPLGLWAAMAAPWVALFQIGAGVLTVTSGIGIVEVSVHMAAGTLLLALMWIAFLATADRQGAGARSPNDPSSVGHRPGAGPSPANVTA